MPDHHVELGSGRRRARDRRRDPTDRARPRSRRGRCAQPRIRAADASPGDWRPWRRRPGRGSPTCSARTTWLGSDAAELDDEAERDARWRSSASAPSRTSRPALVCRISQAAHGAMATAKEVIEGRSCEMKGAIEGNAEGCHDLEGRERHRDPEQDAAGQALAELSGRPCSGLIDHRPAAPSSLRDFGWRSSPWLIRGVSRRNLFLSNEKRPEQFTCARPNVK